MAKTFLLLLGCQFASVDVGAQKPSEYEVKAVYLLHFGRFVRWPEDAPGRRADAFTICVLGDDPFGAILDKTLAGESLDGKPAVIRRIRSVEAAEGCRMVFVSLSEKGRLGEILDSLSEASILTVSDLEGFSRRGGMIELVMDEERVRFEVNLAAATTAGLDFSSELLKVARSVRRDSSGIQGNRVLAVRATRRGVELAEAGSSGGT